MFGLLKKLVQSDAPAAPPRPAPRDPPAAVELPGGAPFVMADHLDRHEGFPYLRWDDAWHWSGTFPESARDAAWDAVVSAWHAHLCAALGPGFRVDHVPGARLISSLDARPAQATLEYMTRTQRRIRESLEGIAEEQSGVHLLVVLDDDDSYYRFISRFYPEEGEFAASSGVQVYDAFVTYFATTRGHLRDMEPVIAHEMTHGFVSHLPLPKWLNEGIAVNMELRLTGFGGPPYPPGEMAARHAAFWDELRVQQFWSGDSYSDPRAEANTLSYDLGRILVEQLSTDWSRFASFVREANWRDAGAAAAKEHFGVSLGTLAAAVAGLEPSASLEPDPSTWPASRSAGPASSH